MKNPLTPAGIEPATFRFVAQHLNHCATAVPREEEFILFSVSGLEGYEWALNPGRFSPGKDPQYEMRRRLGGPPIWYGLFFF